MANPLSTSARFENLFRERYVRFFSEIDKGHFSIGCDLDFSDFIQTIHEGIYLLERPFWEKSLPKLLKKTNNPRFIQKIEILCKLHLIDLNGAEETPPEHFSSQSGTLTLNALLFPSIVEISSSFFYIPSFPQIHRSLHGGENTCGFHALKNALIALAYLNRSIPVSKRELFNDLSFYQNLEPLFLFARENTSQEDATAIDLKKAWRAVVNNEILPFPHFQRTINWNHSDLSIFHIGTNISCEGPGLVIADHQSLDSIVNLKRLTQKQGPCHHAFLIGDNGHWTTVIYEKDSLGKIRWYGIDSGENSTSQRPLKTIHYISDALEQVDQIALRLYSRIFDMIYFQRVFSYLQTHQHVDSVDKEMIHSAQEFLQKMEWESHSNTYIQCTRYLADKIAPDSNSEIITDPFNSFELNFAILESILPPTETIQTLLHRLKRLSIKKFEVLINFMSKCSNQLSVRTNEMHDLLLVSVELAERCSEPALTSIFKNMIASYDFLTIRDAAVMALEWEIPFALIENALIQNLSLSVEVRTYLAQNHRFKRRMILRLGYLLEEISDPTRARQLACSILDHYALFAPKKNVHAKHLIEMAQTVLEKTSEYLSENGMSNPNNPYEIAQKHRLAQKKQTGIKQFFKLSPNDQMTGQSAFRLYQPSVVTSWNNTQMTRKDIPEHVSTTLIRHIFRHIEHRLQKKNSKKAQSLNDYISQEKYNFVSTGENLSFSTLKSNFLSDPYIHHLLQLPQNPNEPISQEQYQFYCLIANLAQQSSRIARGELLSPQEEMLLSYSRYIYFCKEGKKEAIQNVYRLLPESKQIRQVCAPREWIERFLYNFISAKIEGIINTDFFLKKLGISIREERLVHHAHFLIRRFGKQLGLNPDAALDIWTQSLEPSVHTLDEVKFLKEFYSMLNISTLYSECVVALRNEFFRIVKKHEKEKNEAERNMPSYLTEIADRYQLPLDSVFLMDDEQFQIIGISSLIAHHVLDHLEIFKIPNIQEMSVDEIIKWRQLSKFQEPIDLSESPHLSENDLATIRYLTFPMTLDQFKKEYPTVSVIDAPIWGQFGIEVENPPFSIPHEQLKLIMDTLLSKGIIEDDLGATLVLLPKGIDLTTLSNLGMNIHFTSGELIKDTIEAQKTSEWMVFSNSILRGSRGKKSVFDTFSEPIPIKRLKIQDYTPNLLPLLAFVTLRDKIYPHELLFARTKYPNAIAKEQNLRFTVNRIPSIPLVELSVPLIHYTPTSAGIAFSYKV